MHNTADNDTHAGGFPGHFEQLQGVQRTEPIVADFGEREPHTGGRIAAPAQRKGPQVFLVRAEDDEVEDLSVVQEQRRRQLLQRVPAKEHL